MGTKFVFSLHLTPIIVKVLVFNEILMLANVCVYTIVLIPPN